MGRSVPYLWCASSERSLAWTWASATPKSPDPYFTAVFRAMRNRVFSKNRLHMKTPRGLSFFGKITRPSARGAVIFWETTTSSLLSCLNTKPVMRNTIATIYIVGRSYRYALPVFTSHWGLILRPSKSVIHITVRQWHCVISIILHTWFMDAFTWSLRPRVMTCPIDFCPAHPDN